MSDFDLSRFVSKQWNLAHEGDPDVPPRSPLPELVLPSAAPYEFPTKVATKEYFKNMLNRWPLGQTIQEPDASQLRWLIEQHPHTSLKIGPGISFFYTWEAAPYGTLGFHAMRVDRQAVDFSYLKCIDSPEKPLARVLKALRNEVGMDIARAKGRFFDEHADEGSRVPCAVSGRLVTIVESHADHALPNTFHLLATHWLAARRIEPDTVRLIVGCGGTKTVFADRALAKDWREYHRDIAHIRVVAAEPKIIPNRDNYATEDNGLGHCAGTLNSL
jgi:hypothetical protein